MTKHKVPEDLGREMRKMASTMLGAPPDELNIKKAELRELIKGVYDIGWHTGLRAQLEDAKPNFETEPKLQNWREFLDSE